MVWYDVYKEKMAKVLKTKWGLRAGHTVEVGIRGKGQGSEMT